MNKLIALVGMPGCGKDTATQLFKKHRFKEIRFGDITDILLKQQNKEINEKNEAEARLLLRKKYGMEAYALMNKEKIDKYLLKGNVVINGLRSYEEYLFLKKHYPFLIVISIHASQKTRIKRLKNRKIRPLSEQEVKKRDYKEIAELHLGGTIAMADIVIVNEGTKSEFINKIEKVIASL